MTLCLLARCPRSPRLGIAIAAERLAIGMQCDGAIAPQAGAAMVLGAIAPSVNRFAVTQLARGASAAEALRALLASDATCSTLPIAVLAASGDIALHPGTRADPRGAWRRSDGFAALTDAVAADAALEAAHGRFVASHTLDLDARLLAALEAGAATQYALRSAALVVWHTQAYSEIDLRVDLHDRPIDELRRVYDEYLPFGAYYDERARNPRQAISQREFAERLARERGRPGEVA